MLEKYTEVEKPDFLKEVKPKQGNIIFKPESAENALKEICIATRDCCLENTCICDAARDAIPYVGMEYFSRVGSLKQKGIYSHKTDEREAVILYDDNFYKIEVCDRSMDYSTWYLFTVPYI